MWTILRVSGQHYSDISKAEPEDRSRASAGGGEQQKEQDAENSELAQAERFLGGAQCCLDLLFEITDCHASVLTFLVAQPMLFGKGFEYLDILA